MVGDIQISDGVILIIMDTLLLDGTILIMDGATQVITDGITLIMDMVTITEIITIVTIHTIQADVAQALIIQVLLSIQEIIPQTEITQTETQLTTPITETIQPQEPPLHFPEEVLLKTTQIVTELSPELTPDNKVPATIIITPRPVLTILREIAQAEHPHLHRIVVEVAEDPHQEEEDNLHF